MFTIVSTYKMYAYLKQCACDILSICSQKKYLYILCHAQENQARRGTKSNQILKCSLYKISIAVICVCVGSYVIKVCE